MSNYYATFLSRTHAFLAANHLRSMNIAYEISHIPREIAAEPCAMGLKLLGECFDKAYSIIKHLDIPGCSFYKEIRNPGSYISQYLKIEEESQ